MHNLQHAETGTHHLISLLDELSGGIDPDFDTAYDELDREFAELRLQLGHA